MCAREIVKTFPFSIYFGLRTKVYHIVIFNICLTHARRLTNEQIPMHPMQSPVLTPTRPNQQKWRKLRDLLRVSILFVQSRGGWRRSHRSLQRGEENHRIHEGSCNKSRMPRRNCTEKHRDPRRLPRLCQSSALRTHVDHVNRVEKWKPRETFSCL